MQLGKSGVHKKLLRILCKFAADKGLPLLTRKMEKIIKEEKSVVKPTVKSANSIYIKGARVHNLKNVTVEIPRNKLIVVTGVSGSGKSSLTIDTLYAEEQRR